MSEVPIDVTVTIVLESRYCADGTVERLARDAISRCFACRRPGDRVGRVEILKAVLSIQGVRGARVVRFCRTADRECTDAPQAEVDVSRDERPRLGRLEVQVEQE